MEESKLDHLEKRLNSVLELSRTVKERVTSADIALNGSNIKDDEKPGMSQEPNGFFERAHNILNDIETSLDSANCRAGVMLENRDSKICSV